MRHALQRALPYNLFPMQMSICPKPIGRSKHASRQRSNDTQPLHIAGGLGQEKLVGMGWENWGPQTHVLYEDIRKDPVAARASPHLRMAPSL